MLRDEVAVEFDRPFHSTRLVLFNRFREQLAHRGRRRRTRRGDLEFARHRPLPDHAAFFCR